MVEGKSTSGRARGRLRDVSGRPTKGGLVQVTRSVDPDDLETLRAEAQRRARVRKTARADVSELVREAIRAWLAKAAKR